MIQIKTYNCSNPRCKNNKERIKEENLIKRVEEEGHIDYCCPLCDQVIICVHTEEYNKKYNLK